MVNLDIFQAIAAEIPESYMATLTDDDSIKGIG
jgi:hypothetical protein